MMLARCLILITLLLSFHATASEEVPGVLVIEPYIELHTGPGRGYPVHHVVGAGDEIRILKRRTSWFLLETNDRRPKQGWARLREMSKTAATIDERGTIYAGFPGYDQTGRGWYWHASGGDFGGAASISASAGYRLTSNIHLAVEGTQILGDFSDGKMLSASVTHYPFPTWRVSPYFQLGAGILQTEPAATLVQAEDRTDNTLIVGGGLSVHLNSRFNFFMDYRRHTVLTSRDQNEEIDQWKLGINVSL